MFTIGLTSIKNGIKRRFSKNRLKTFDLVQLGWDFITLENRLEAHNFGVGSQHACKRYQMQCKCALKVTISKRYTKSLRKT
jgi:hypothetical protein